MRILFLAGYWHALCSFRPFAGLTRIRGHKAASADSCSEFNLRGLRGRRERRNHIKSDLRPENRREKKVGNKPAPGSYAYHRFCDGK